jgi:hypothetical protein
MHETRTREVRVHEIDLDSLDHGEIWTVDLESVDSGFGFWKKGAS